MTKMALRIAFSLLCLIAVALLLNISRVAIRGSSVAAAANMKTASVHPYTVVLSETMIDPSGQTREGPTTTFARRSDGATVVRGGTHAFADRILELAEFRVLTNERIRAKSSTPSTTPIQSRLRDPNHNCTLNMLGQPATNTDERVLGTETIAGLRTVKVGSAPKHRITAWYALDYSCAQVGFRMDYQEGDASDVQVVEFTPGEPSPALFDVDGYAEVQPSALGPVPLPGQRALIRKFEILDERYFARRRERGLPLPAADASTKLRLPLPAADASIKPQAK